jgi:serine/threonine protein kinase
MTNTQQKKFVDFPVTFGNYVARRAVGTGSTCVVAEAIHRETGQVYAVKIIKADSSMSANLKNAVEREIRVLQRLDHPNIVRLVDVIRTADRIFVVMEHCEGGTLLDHILADGLKTVRELKRIFRGIVRGVSYLHSQGISHGDLKPDNIVLAKGGGVKLIDFGYCKETPIGFDSDKSGTVKYASPELLRRGVYNTQKADSWSLGILLFVMSTKTFPYRSSEDYIVKELILRGELLQPITMASELISLHRSLTHPSPNERLSAEDALTARCLCFGDVNCGSVPKSSDWKEVKRGPANVAGEEELDYVCPF